jgi:hypothetical protein
MAIRGELCTNSVMKGSRLQSLQGMYPFSPVHDPFAVENLLNHIFQLDF